MNRTRTRCEYVPVRSDAASLPHAIRLSAFADVSAYNRPVGAFT